MNKFQAAAQKDKDNHLWQPNYASLPHKLPSLPEPEISGCSFRFFCIFTLQACFFSGRDRAGEEKKSKPKNEHHQQKHEKEDDAEKKKFNNYLCRDWISGHPLAKAGAWKRLFRSCWPDQDAAELKRLFGPEDAETEKNLSKAELKFHHAVFPLNSTGKALIAPRDEKTGKVSPGPITYEVVNADSRCEVVIDYVPRDVNPEQAEKVLRNLCFAVFAFKKQGAAIGGKSGIWGRIHATHCWVEAGPQVPRNKNTASILKQKKVDPCQCR